MKLQLFTQQQIQKYASALQQTRGDYYCEKHSQCCNQFALLCFTNVAKASYKTYALVYIFQLITNTKKFKENPKKQIPKFLFNYMKSVSFTAMDFLIMRRVMCLYHKLISTSSKSLIISNFLGGLYLWIQSGNRQMQIAMYSLNKTTQMLYNMHIRRHPNLRIPYGQALLFAISMAILCYHFFNHQDLFKPAYKKAFQYLFKNP